MVDDSGAQEILHAGVVIILIGALALAYTIVLYAGATECGPGATIIPCSLPFWKATAVMSLIVGSVVMAGSLVITPAVKARVRAWLSRSSIDRVPADADDAEW
jgi:hypothetical protein